MSHFFSSHFIYLNTLISLRFFLYQSAPTASQVLAAHNSSDTPSVPSTTQQTPIPIGNTYIINIHRHMFSFYFCSFHLLLVPQCNRRMSLLLLCPVFLAQRHNCLHVSPNRVTLLVNIIYIVLYYIYIYIYIYLILSNINRVLSFFLH